MNKQLIVLAIAILLICIVFSGCIDNQTGVYTSTNPPANIKTFASALEGEMIRFYFILEDENGANVVSNGEVMFEIFDEYDTSLYIDEFDVKKSEFVDYGFQLTGASMGKAYEWRVPIDDIEKGMSLIGIGKATINFITPKLKSLHAEDNFVQIPTYSEDEIQDIQDAEYEESAISVNKKIRKGNFEITVVKVGFFESYEWGIQTQYFRADLEVKNVGTESDYFMPDGVVIIDNQNNQYQQNYFGTLNNFFTVYPDVTINGYFLFENVPTMITSLRLVFELGYDESFNPYLFEYNINLV